MLSKNRRWAALLWIVVCGMWLVCVPLIKSGLITKLRLSSIGPSLGIGRDELCYGKGFRPFVNRTLRPDWDLMKTVPYKMLPHFKNPCFLQKVTVWVGDRIKSQQKLRCLPYFFIIGFPKSGTTDLWHRILRHPDVVYGNKGKELMFFNRKRFYNNRSLDHYISYFDEAANIIQDVVSSSACESHLFPYHHLITGEASVDTIFDNKRWSQLPGNQGCNEPVITTADFLRHLMPDTRLIVVMRNPVERVYSDYIYEGKILRYNLSKADFHEAVLKAIKNHEDCRQYFTERGCAYNGSLETYKARLRVGMYHIFIRDWLRVFPWEQMLFIRTDDLSGENAIKTYQKIFRFLQTRPFTRAEEEKYLRHKRRMNARHKEGRGLGDMLDATKRILTNFYEPHNVALAKLLNERYLWK
ncbi:hypothetical protein CHS0354_009040 [Potamilus streckersoni]|uniref:Sulfotransferase domain-containing protein n=1 Tax=Potamilus streckersoni TaxID=2493646 RepID=A0AAE0WEF9_9BIVA|nr:hypothetical protein CHS0354_009040 [Potamilus streckersoni]